MSYVVLARKYRPRNFAQMAGQEHVVQALTNALGQQRLHHAYLFTGTRGIGKTTVSRILAKSLNCTGPDGTGGITAQPCGVCEACTAIDADRYVDYIELDAASNRSIEEVRDLIERAAYKPAVGRFKVFMIDEAHQLTRDAFNALLKTLEEPPEYLKFVLATTDPEKMLPTVLSRCLQFNLRPMAPEVVTQHLARVLDAESVPAEDGALRLLGRAARGSMRDALSLTDQAIAYGGGQLTEEGVAAMLGVAGAGLVLCAQAGAQEYAQVISVQPRMVTIQQQQCRQVSVQGQNTGSTAGMLIGGVAGGILGNQIGKGTGRTVATAAGAVTGAVVGNQIGGQQGAPQQQTVCDNVPVTVQQGEIVTFSFRGRQFTHVFEQ